MRERLPSDVWYSGGLYISWNGRPEGQVWVTHDRALAYGRESDWKWRCTPFQGASGGCRPKRIAELVRDWWSGIGPDEH